MRMSEPFQELGSWKGAQAGEESVPGRRTTRSLQRERSFILPREEGHMTGDCRRGTEWWEMTSEEGQIMQGLEGHGEEFGFYSKNKEVDRSDARA